MSLPIEDYALLSDCHTAALVSRSGSIDWLCFPRFDSPACFAALLGDEENGRWQIRPKGCFDVSRKYIDGTMVLETTFRTEGGTCRLVDCLLVGDEHPTLIRFLAGVEGSVELELELIIRFDYGSVIPWVRRLAGEARGIRAVAGPVSLVLSSPVPLQGENLHTVSEFFVKAGEKYPFVLTWSLSHERIGARIDNPWIAVRRTIYWWKEWSDRCEYDGCDKEAVTRSLLTLKALTYETTGGIVAAPTTSLPEEIGGCRNWDYRYCWLRDSTFTLYSLLNAGYREEADYWRSWLIRAVAGTPTQLKIMYGLGGERRLTELELDWLSGYENSRPVRIGNAAHGQLQFDVFGEVMDTLDLAMRSGLPRSDDAWRIQNKMIQFLQEKWREPDDGIWEIRGPRRHFTHSKMMAWVAVDRAIKAVREFGFEGPVDDWIQLRERIKRDVCENGYSHRLKSFVQYYGGEDLDASLLMMGLVGFLCPDDPRLAGTVSAIQEHLTKDGFLMRYDTSKQVDGLPGEEGAFLACSFWLADNLVLLNRVEEAREIFDRVSALKNDVGLFSEEYCPARKRMLGNYPQAFSHIAHVNTASNVSKRIGPASDRSHAGRR